jgi:UDPglucose 6-dehydrogenase
MLARLCEKLSGADVNVVTDALGLDTRIGAKYLKGAVSYGGPCFPRDNRAFAALALRSGARSDLAEATDTFNRAQISTIADVVRGRRRGDERVGILGLTYKPNTDVVEEAFGLLLAEELDAAEIPVVVFDPSANLTRAFGSHPKIHVAPSAEECIAQSAVVVLATPWQEFRDLPVEAWLQPDFAARSFNQRARIVIDCWHALGHLANMQGLQYVRLGFGAPAERPVAAATSSR